MSKFHINKHGVPAPCRATKGNCPLGGDSGNENHYNTEAEAQAGADMKHEAQHSILPGVNSFNKHGNYSYDKQELDEMDGLAIAVEYDGKSFAGEVIGSHYAGDESANNGIIIQDGEGNVKHIKSHRLTDVKLEGDTEFDEMEEENARQLLTGAEESNPAKRREFTEEDMVFRDKFADRTVYLALGHANNDSYYARKSNMHNFREDQGMDNIARVFSENEGINDPHWEVKQELLYYFPRPENSQQVGQGRSYGMQNPMEAYNNEDADEAEKRLNDTTDAIVDIHKFMRETGSQPLIRRKLAEKNEEKVFERFSEQNKVEGKFSKGAAQQASKVFSSFANNEKFYRYENDEYAALDYYERGGGKLGSSQEQIKAQSYGFKLAKEFHANKVLSGSLEQDNKQIVNRMKKKFSNMFYSEEK